MKTQRSNDGNGPPIDAPDVVGRLVRLRRYNGTLVRPRDRAAAKKRLDELEAALPQHITAEADRVITTVTQEIRGVGSSVAALHCDLTPVMALARGEVMLDDSMSLEQQKVAADLQQAVLIARKRTIAAAMKEEKAATLIARKRMIVEAMKEEKAVARAVAKEEKVAGLAAAFARGRARA